PLALGVEVGDRAGADIADQRRLGGDRLAAAAKQPRRLDAQIFGDNGDLIGAQAPMAVQEIGHGGRRTSERLGEAAARFASVFEAGADLVDGPSSTPVNAGALAGWRPRLRHLGAANLTD